jgi:hypothetical protein
MLPSDRHPHILRAMSYSLAPEASAYMAVVVGMSEPFLDKVERDTGGHGTHAEAMAQPLW